jgi:hypothetical protein
MVLRLFGAVSSEVLTRQTRHRNLVTVPDGWTPEDANLASLLRSQRLARFVHSSHDQTNFVNL